MNIKTKPLTFKHRPLNERQITQINNQLEHTNWDFTLNTNANEAYNLFIDKVTQTINTFAPEKTCNISRSKVRKMPWFSSGLQRSSFTVRKLYRKAMGKNKEHPDFLKYKSYKNAYNRIKRSAKQHYYEEQLTKYKSNINMTWKLIHEIVGKHKNAKFIPDSFPNKSKSELTNDFCEYFQSIGSTLANKIPEGKHPHSHYMTQPNINTLFTAPTDRHEVTTIISSLKNSKSSGSDNILNNLLLKKIKHTIALPLANLINNSISTGSVPNALKVAKIIPVYKNGDHDELGNYRPISLLPAISKIYEKVMYKRLYNFLHKNIIFYKSQYGFRSKHSTINAVSDFVEDVLNGYENKERVHLLFILIYQRLSTPSTTKYS